MLGNATWPLKIRREASLWLWGHYDTPTLWWLTQHSNITFYLFNTEIKMPPSKLPPRKPPPPENCAPRIKLSFKKLKLYLWLNTIG